MSISTVVMHTSVWTDEVSDVERAATMVAGIIADCGWSVDVTDYWKENNKIRIIVDVPVGLYEEEDPDEVCDEVIRDLMKDTGFQIDLDDVTYEE